MNNTSPASSLVSGTTEPTVSAPAVQLVSVNVGLPRIIGALRSGEQVLSGIGKQPVATDRLFLSSLNLEGDRQADLTVHGGPDKAVYAYASEHLPEWNAELMPDPPFGPGTFGENLTTAGWLEDRVCIGDLWQWGDALLQVAQPRSPCYKLAMVTRRLDMLKRFVRSGRTGWYLRVLQPGQVRVAGPIAVIERHPAGVTVLATHQATLGHTPRSEVERVLAVDALAASWREALEDRLAHTFA